MTQNPVEAEIPMDINRTDALTIISGFLLIRVLRISRTRSIEC